MNEHDILLKLAEDARDSAKLKAAVALSELAREFGPDPVSDVVASVMKQFFPDRVEIFCEPCGGTGTVANLDETAIRDCPECDGRGWS